MNASTFPIKRLRLRYDFTYLHYKHCRFFVLFFVAKEKGVGRDDETTIGAANAVTSSRPLGGAKDGHPFHLVAIKEEDVTSNELSIRCMANAHVGMLCP